MSLRMSVSLLEANAKLCVNVHMHIILGRRYLGFTRLTEGAVIPSHLKMTHSLLFLRITLISL